MSGIQAHIRAELPDLPRKARRIAELIVDRPESVIHMSITEVAEECEVSEGSVVAFCQRFGATGFQELKIQIARNLIEPVRLIQEDLHEGDDPETAADHVFAAHAASLAETRRVLSGDALALAVLYIKKARRVEVYGVGSSAPIDSHVQAVSAGMTGPEVATITVSHTGSTVETVLATRLAREAGAMTIGITRLGKSPLAAHCEVLLHTVANETRYRPEAMSSRVAQLAIIDTLVSCCALTDTTRAVERLERSARILSEKRF